MPITKSAKKALRQSDKKRVYNIRRKNKVDDAVKKIEKLVKAGKGADAMKLMPIAQKAIDKAIKHNTLNRNTGSRMKSRLSRVLSKAK